MLQSRESRMDLSLILRDIFYSRCQFSVNERKCRFHGRSDDGFVASIGYMVEYLQDGRWNQRK